MYDCRIQLVILRLATGNALVPNPDRGCPDASLVLRNQLHIRSAPVLHSFGQQIKAERLFSPKRET